MSSSTTTDAQISTSTVNSPATADGQPSGDGARTLRQWSVLALGVVILVTGCLVAARWQWERHVERSAAVEIIQTNYAQPPVPLADLLPRAGVSVGETDVWRSVRMTGRYEPERTVFLRNRPINQQAAFHVLVPFVTDDGTVLVVNRGWVQYDNGSARPDAVPAPPSGEVEVVVRLRAEEPASERGAPPGQVQAINTQQVLDAGPDGGAWAAGATYEAYGSLASESPAPTESIFALPKPNTDPRSHLSYTFQWIVFAIGGVVGLGILLARERRERTLHDLDGEAHPFAPAPGPDSTAGAVTGTATRRRPSRAPSAEEIEDALIDARSAR